jgi:hypothetical protein
MSEENQNTLFFSLLIIIVGITSFVAGYYYGAG